MMRTAADLADRLADRLRRLMPSGDRKDRLVRALAGGFADDHRPIDASVCRAVETVGRRHSRHLELHFSAEPAADGEEMPGWPPPDGREIRRRAAGFSSVERKSGICLIRLDTLDALSWARPYLDAAAALAAGADRVVLDLRANGGGDPATVAAIAGWLLGDKAQHLSDVVHRDRRRQWWTPDLPAGTAFTGEVAVLVSGRTYSSAEALAFHLSERGRATVIGEATRGAADHIVPVRLSPHVLGFLPEAEVHDATTGANWEGVGVLPHIACPADEALAVAQDRFRPI